MLFARAAMVDDTYGIMQVYLHCLVAASVAQSYNAWLTAMCFPGLRGVSTFLQKVLVDCNVAWLTAMCSPGSQGVCKSVMKSRPLTGCCIASHSGSEQSMQSRQLMCTTHTALSHNSVFIVYELLMTEWSCHHKH